MKPERWPHRWPMHSSTEDLLFCGCVACQHELAWVEQNLARIERRIHEIERLHALEQRLATPMWRPIPIVLPQLTWGRRLYNKLLKKSSTLPRAISRPKQIRGVATK